MSASYLKLFVDCLDKYRKLSDAEFGRLVRAGLEYKGTSSEPKLSGREELLWDGMKLEIDRDNKRYDVVSEARAEAGRKGAEARWQKPLANGKCYLPHGKNGQDKEEDKEEDKDPPISPRGDDERFLSFWAAYPRKVAKGDARKAWGKIRPSAKLHAAMLAAIETQKQSDQWQRDGGQFIPYPATWLNQARWEDEPTGGTGIANGTRRDDGKVFYDGKWVTV